ncbi:hypothetical protein Lal_00043188 [Lupinus albus]|nr:hypothetical protein Lal_00043188 [Lupinus albus]
MSALKRQRTSSNNYIGLDNSSIISNSLFGFRYPYYASDLKLARLAKFTDRGITLTCYTNLSWMTESGFTFPELLQYQGVQVCVELYGKMYPSLIREFYSNFQCKNRFIILDEDLIADVGGLARFGRPYGIFAVNAYRTMLRDTEHSVASQKPFAYALAVEYRMMFTLLAYCLVPRHTNHTEPTIDDLFLLFAIRERQRVNWPKLILLYMLEFSMTTLVDGAWTYFEDINASPRGTDLPNPVDDSDEDTVVHPVYYHALDEVEDVEDDPEEDSDGE